MSVVMRPRSKGLILVLLVRFLSLLSMAFWDGLVVAGFGVVGGDGGTGGKGLDLVWNQVLASDGSRSRREPKTQKQGETELDTDTRY